MGRFRPFLCIVLVLAGCAGPPSISGTGSSAVTLSTMSYDVVALGASNTAGRGRGRTADGISPDHAYPAQRERLLASQGCHVRILNAGRAGDTTDMMLDRLPSVIGPGTRLVILQPGGNDERRGSARGTSLNVDAVQRAVTQQGARLVMLDDLEGIAGPYRLADGQHFSAEGHARLAAYLAPTVRAAGVCRP